MAASAPEKVISRLIVCLQRRADLIDQYVDEYPWWESRRKNVISSLNRIAADIKEFDDDTNEAIVAASTAGVVGGVTFISGLILAPFTAGLSTALCAVGGTVATVGGGTAAAISVAKFTVDAFAVLLAADGVLRGDSADTRRIADILTLIQALSQEINALLGELRCGSLDDKIEVVQTLHGVALFCGDTWIAERLLAIAYTLAVEMLPYDHECRDGIRKSQSENQSGESLPLTIGTTLLAVSLVAMITALMKQNMEKSAPAMMEAGEEVALLPEMVETGEEIASLELGVVAAEVLLPTIAIVLSIITLVTAAKELDEGSKVAAKVRDAANKLSLYTREAEKVYVKLKVFKRSKQSRDEEEEKKKKKQRYLMSIVSASTFNVKGTRQNDDYKNFLSNVFRVLNDNFHCQLHHLQECIWASTSVWLGIEPSHDILPLDFLVTVNPTLEAGIAYRTTFLDQHDMPDMVSTLSDRIHCLKFSTKINFEVIIERDGTPQITKQHSYGFPLLLLSWLLQRNTRPFESRADHAVYRVCRRMLQSRKIACHCWRRLQLRYQKDTVGRAS